MGDTRPLPQPDSETAQPRTPPPRTPSRTRPRRRRYLKRAAIAAAACTALCVTGAAVLWCVTPSADEATQLASEQAAAHGIAFPGPPAPANFSRPLIATEDHRFNAEPGIDLLAVGRVVEGKLTGAPDQGGATLEQQLAKMLYTPTQTGFSAEVKQVVVAFKLNLKFAKQQILDLYAEVAYYGHGYYGLEQASCGYFGHPSRELTVVQGAMLAGVVNAPSVDDPISDPANARVRLTHVIDRMVAVGYLTPTQGQQALRAPLGLVTDSAAASASAGC